MTMTSMSPATVSRAAVAAIDYGIIDKERGAVFTKQPVVDFMLDLIGYTPSLPLYERRILEPSFGGARFLLTAVDRLLASWRAHSEASDYSELLDALRAVELDTETYEAVKRHLREHLVEQGFSEFEAAKLAEAWLVQGDFLWAELDGLFDFVIGNPPYVRQELIPDESLVAYRAAFSTMVGRADLYVAFIERCLDLLAPQGRLSFICADAWVRNEYGRALRRKVASEFHMREYVDMYGVEAFEAEVSAYTSIFDIERGQPGTTVATKALSADVDHLTALARAMTGAPTKGLAPVRAVERLASDGSPWLLSVASQVSVIEDLEARFPTLQEAGLRVGIGVATGADKVFVAPLDGLDVEDDRKLPVAMGRDVSRGRLEWSGKGVLNPYSEGGGLVDLAQYPRLAAYLEPHFELLAKRHTAKENVTKRWYKTIDRITPSLTWEPKLLIPDIRGDGDSIAYDEGTVYPHHNLYFITSQTWNLRALQALLRSGIAHLFVEAYSTRLGGGYLRFQAQNLKRIRVPHWDSISDEDKAAMTEAGERGNRLDPSLIERIYGLDSGELAFLAEGE